MIFALILECKQAQDQEQKKKVRKIFTQAVALALSNGWCAVKMAGNKLSALSSSFLSTHNTVHTTRIKLLFCLSCQLILQMRSYIAHSASRITQAR